MKEVIKFELFATEKFANDFAYVSNMSVEELKEVNIYRAELVKLLNAEARPLALPTRPPVFDRYN